MTRYRNTRTGLVVDVPETAQTRTDRPKRDKQWSEHLRRLSRSRRWERVSDSTKVGMPKSRPKRKKGQPTPDPEPKSGLAAFKVDELKELAAERGVDLGDAKSKTDIIAAIESAEAGQSDNGNGGQE